MPPPYGDGSIICITRGESVIRLPTVRDAFQQVEGAPPVFVWELQSQKAMDGDETRFVGKVRGIPMPEVTWYHDGKVVYDNPDFRTSYNKETGEVVLFIVELFPQDTGVYECVAVNRYGRATTGARLDVEGKSAECDTTFPYGVLTLLAGRREGLPAC